MTERLIFAHPNESMPHVADQELRVGALPAAAGVLSPPSPRDIAAALGKVNGEWFVEFLRHLHKLSRNRAFEVGEVAEQCGISDTSGLSPRYVLDEELQKWDDLAERYGFSREHAYRDIKEALEALKQLRAPESFMGRPSDMTLADTQGGSQDSTRAILEATERFIRECDKQDWIKERTDLQLRVRNQRKELRRMHRDERRRAECERATKRHVAAIHRSHALMSAWLRTPPPSSETVRRVVSDALYLAKQESGRFTERAHEHLLMLLEHWLATHEPGISAP